MTQTRHRKGCPMPHCCCLLPWSLIRNADKDDEEEGSGNQDVCIVEDIEVSSAPASATASLGPAILVTLRAHGNEKAAKTFSGKIRTKEKLARLEEVVRKQLLSELKPSSKISFMFDGDLLDLDKTPSSYDMEDEDMIDVLIK